MKNTLAALLFLCIITSAHGHLAAVPLHGVSDAFSAAINGEAVAFTPRVNVPPASTKGADDRRAMTDSRDGETLKLAQLQDPIAAPQTSGTTPPISSLNKVMYVDPTSTVDLVDQVNTLFAHCLNACEVHIPAGNYGPGFTTPVGTDVLHPTILLSHNTQRLVGDGQGITNIIDTNARPFIDGHSASFSINPGVVVSGFTLRCTNVAAVCITAGDAIGFRIRDIEMIGPGGQTNSESSGTSQAIVLVNKSGWFERWKFDDVVIGGFHVNLHFATPAGGTDSFGYGQAEQVTSSMGCGDHGVQIDSGANVYNIIKFEYQFNYACKGVTTGTEVFTVGGSLPVRTSM